MLRLKQVRKSFGSLVAVNDLSLEIVRGEVFGLLGPNGAGKSTTVNLCVGLLTPDRGEVELDGLGRPDEPHVRAKVGVAPQQLAIYENLTGAENVRFFGRMYGLRGAELSRRTDEALEFVGLSDRRKDSAGTYSGGMKRRLNFAVAIVHDPELLILDEPTVGVDPQSRNAIFERIEELRKRGTTVIYTTHYMEEAQRLCDRVGILDHGALLALDTVEGLIRAHGGAHRVVIERTSGRVVLDAADPLAALRSIQAERDLLSFHVERPNLETVFLNLTGRSLRDE